MNYQISISGMHCMGCKNLIQMSLEDVGLEKVDVNPDLGKALFTSSKTKTEIEVLLDTVFKDLKEYSYSNFNIIS